MAMISGKLRPCRFVFLGDHTQVGSRNAACRDALEMGCEWLFFVDSDMDFPEDILQRLKACDADIACPDMWSRNWPSFRTVLRGAEPDEKGMRRAFSVPGSPTGIEEVDACGMACTLIKTSLLKKMDPPWFVAGSHGEDMSFCFVAKEKHGAIIKCDFGVIAGHWGACRMAGQEWTKKAQFGTTIGPDGRVVT